MDTECSYCYSTEYLLNATCGHNFCKDCLNTLKIVKNCPFDDKYADFSLMFRKIKMIEICEKHHKKVNGICKEHFVKICNECNLHKCCKIILGGNEEVDREIEKVAGEIREMKEKFGVISTEKSEILNKAALWLREEAEENARISNILNCVGKISQESKVAILQRIKQLNLLENLDIHSTNTRLNQIIFNAVESNSINSNRKTDSANPLAEDTSLAYLLESLQDTQEKAIMKNQIMHEETTKIGLIRNLLVFFCNFDIADNLNHEYTALFCNKTKRNINISGIGVGTPSILGTSIYVHFTISSEIGKIIYADSWVLIEYIEGFLTQFVPFSIGLNLPSNKEFIICIEVIGERYHVFSDTILYKNYATVKDIDGTNFNSFIPILYLGYTNSELWQ